MVFSERVWHIQRWCSSVAENALHRRERLAVQLSDVKGRKLKAFRWWYVGYERERVGVEFSIFLEKGVSGCSMRSKCFVFLGLAFVPPLLRKR